MQLIDLVAKHADAQVATDADGEFIYWGTWLPVSAEILQSAQDDLEALERAAKESEINEQVCAMIAEQYSITDEIKLIRTAPSHEFDVYNEHAEACRQWGREQKALLGL